MADVLGGFGRRVLVTQTGTIAAANSADFGVFDAGRFPRLSGLVLVNSVTNATANLQFRFQSVSGTTQITSNLAVASGGTEFSVINPANFVGLGITPVQSATLFAVQVFGELVR